MTNTRDDIINDFASRIRRDIDSNRAIILMGDFNEGISSRENTHHRLTEMGLLNLFHERSDCPLPKTWNRGSTAIDHVYMSVDVFKSVTKAGYAPFDLIALSDHRGIFFDINMSMLFDEQLKDIEPAHFRKLKSSHIKRVEEYNKLLKEEWDNHKIDRRLDTLIQDFKQEGATKSNIKRLNDLDRHITDIMRYSEKNCTTISRHAKDP